MRTRRLPLGIAVTLALSIPRINDAQRPAYRDASLPVEQRVRDLLGRMTLEEKFWQLYMIPGSPWDSGHDYSRGVFGLQHRTASDARADARLQNAMQRYFMDSTRLGIPIIPFEEGVHGLMRRGAIVFPQAIALAATFDSALVGAVASGIARESRSRGIRQLLSPVVNIATDVRWGRVEETYGEDPHLSSVMGRVFARELERRGVVATPKHFVANVGEGGRDSYPVDISARALEELHYPPFRATLLDAGARSVMTSYNSVDGLPMSQQSALLEGTLRRDWKFSGFVISDQAAVGGATVLHFTEASTATATKRALEAGLDVIFQSSWPQHRPYLEALRRGLVADSIIDRATARVLRAKFTLGLFEDPYVNPDSAAAASGIALRQLAREVASAAIVLLKNDGGRLPLDSTTRTFAVLGADAQETRLGGYTLDDARGLSLRDALRARFGTARVRYAPGPGRGPFRSDEAGSIPALHAGRPLVTIPAAQFDSLRGVYWDNNALQGEPRVVRDEAAIDFRWTLSGPARGIASDWYSARWTGRLKVPATGARRLAVEGNDGYRLWLDGRLLIDNWTKLSYRTTTVNVALAPGSVHDLRMEYFESTGNARVRLLWDSGIRDDSQARIDSAVAVARRSDVAIIAAGIEEGEFRDRSSLALPGRQEELILRVARLGKPVVVVLVGGSAVTMDRWIDSVDAVLMAWYPGEQGGAAISDVLFGAVNPGGRLPITFPKSEGQLPLTYNHKPTGRGDDYLDGSGMAAFPFGHGLSYSTFAYSNLEVRSPVSRDGVATVRFTVTNTGRVAGAEVPQLYVRDVLASVTRPVMELKGFSRVMLHPGESREVTFPVPVSALRFLDANMHWIVEPGVYRILVGASSRDIRLRGALTIPD